MTLSDRMLELLSKLSRRSDLVIAIVVLVAVVMMMIPLPTGLVDVLITINIAISLLILLVSLYVRHPLEFSSLPSVILIATLFRLAITITTTRLILLQADAGEIVSAFGAFVVGGSIAVGLVIFFIITVAQFVVIAKGSERVAEVAARFTLDALPGKQMSIDAELRNGDINQVEARRLRKQLERESQLFGAMDGAMKFVKGDVIAGIVIIFVNLLGGFAVGTLQHGMSLGQAAATYSLLTVGDGLVAQIPALLVSVAAGAMITRVASSDNQEELGHQITSQLLRDARALSLAAAILVGLSLVPGLPTMVFLVLGAILGAGAYAMRRNAGARQSTGDDEPVGVVEPRQGHALAHDEIAALPPSQRVAVRLGSDVGRAVSKAEFAEQGERIRRDLLADLGIETPAIGIYVDDGLDPRRVRIDLEGAPIFDGDIPPDRVLVEEDSAHLDLLGIDYEEGGSLAGQQKAIWVNTSHTSRVAEAGLSSLRPVEIVGKWTAHALRTYADHFVGIQETRRLLSEQEADYADLVREAQETVPLQRIAEVLRRLVAENVPIRNLRVILEAIIEWGQREKEAALLAEQVRTALKRQISFRAADRNNIIAAYVLQPSAEETLRAAVHKASAGTFLNLPDDEAQSIIGQIKHALSHTSAETLPVVLTGMDVRRHMRSFLVQNGIDLPVLSYQELAPEFNVQPLATIGGGQNKSEVRQQPRPIPAARAGTKYGTAF